MKLEFLHWNVAAWRGWVPIFLIVWLSIFQNPPRFRWSSTKRYQADMERPPKKVKVTWRDIFGHCWHSCFMAPKPYVYTSEWWISCLAVKWIGFHRCQKLLISINRTRTSESGMWFIVCGKWQERHGAFSLKMITSPETSPGSLSLSRRSCISLWHGEQRISSSLGMEKILCSLHSPKLT